MIQPDVTTLLERRKAWIRSLRSGSYNQVANSLYIEGYGYCCIGVALSIEGADDYSMERAEADGLFYNNFKAIYDVSKKLENYLIEMNDKRDRDFKFIARFLEVAWQIKVDN